MKKITIIYLTLLVFGLAIFIQSCSQVEDNLVTSPSIGIHPAGWLTKSSPNFHGVAISSNKWDMSQCKSCHGPDFRGGSSGASCFKCHPGGPQACNVCHGNPDHSYPPAALNGQTLESYIGVGVHETHLGDSTLTGREGRVLKCFECHRAFTDFNDTVHINPTNIDNRAEVVFDTLSKTPSGGITPNPVWNRTTATCSSVYCHGDFKNGNYRLLNPPPVPVWTDPSSVHCGTCHGDPTTGDPIPGGSHFQGFTIHECWFCHGRVIDSSGTIFNKSLHINGIVDRGFDTPGYIFNRELIDKIIKRSTDIRKK